MVSVSNHEVGSVEGAAKPPPNLPLKKGEGLG